MKKYISVILFSFLSFFLFGFKVRALDLDINFDKHDHFNFFYEMKEDTPFYRWLVGQGENLYLTLAEYNNTSYLCDNPSYISISYVSDFAEGETYPENAYYVIFVYSASDDYPSTLSYNSESFTWYLNNRSPSFSTSPWYSKGYYYFDINGNYISSSASSGGGLKSFSDTYWSSLSNDNFEYVLSMLYYHRSGFSYYGSLSTKPKIKIDKVIVDEEEYILSSGNWLSNIWHSITSFFTGAKYMNDSGYGLEYFTKDYVITDSKGFPGLIKVLSGIDNDITIPSEYQSKSFSMTDELHLYPLGSCSYDDVALYVKANSNEKFTLYLNDVNSNDEFSYQSSYYSNYVSKINKFMKINPLRVYSTEGDFSNLSINDFSKYVYRLSRYDNFNTYTVYYNPNCYSSVYVEESLEWTNPNSGNTITVSPEYDNWSDPENISTGNSVGITEDINANNLIQKGWSGAGSFIKAANTIVSLSFDLFNEMPVEMQSLLFTFFAIGLVIILIKIFL